VRTNEFPVDGTFAESDSAQAAIIPQQESSSRMRRLATQLVIVPLSEKIKSELHGAIESKPYEFTSAHSGLLPISLTASARL
jgi:hypothetical protein